MTDPYRDKFGGALRVLNQVPRWGCVPRIKESNVAQHSFWVAFYASIICDYLEMSVTEKFACLDYAIRHDLPEAATGDILGPVKRSAVDADRMWSFIATTFKEWGVFQFLAGARNDDSIKRIVKAADLIDDVMVLSEEMAFGNSRAIWLFEVVATRLQKALAKIECDALFVPIMNSCSIVRRSPLTIVQEDSDVS